MIKAESPLVTLDPDTIKALGSVEAFVVVLMLLMITIPAGLFVFNRAASAILKDRQANEASQNKLNTSLMELFQSLNMALQEQTKAIQATQTTLPVSVGKEVTGSVMPGIRIIADEMGDLITNTRATDSRVQEIIEQNAGLKQAIVAGFEGVPEVIRGELSAVIIRLDELNILATATKNTGDRLLNDLSVARADVVGAIAKLTPAPPVPVATPVTPANPVNTVQPEIEKAAA